MPRKPDAEKIRARVAEAISGLPEAEAVRIGGHMSLEVRERRFGWFMVDHHGDGRIAINCKVPALVAAQLQAEVPAQYHVPMYVGHRGWIGLWLDVAEIDWSQVDLCLEQAYWERAPKILLKKLTESRAAGRKGAKRSR
jgi:hypothetical protein